MHRKPMLPIEKFGVALFFVATGAFFVLGEKISDSFMIATGLLAFLGLNLSRWREWKQLPMGIFVGSRMSASAIFLSDGERKKIQEDILSGKRPDTRTKSEKISTVIGFIILGLLLLGILALAVAMFIEST